MVVVVVWGGVKEAVNEAVVVGGVTGPGVRAGKGRMGMMSWELYRFALVFHVALRMESRDNIQGFFMH